MATPLPLEGDGLVENLFYFLWCKDDFGAGPRIFVPHTVLFRFAQPAAWYFTSLRSNKIKKKSKVNLTNAQIEHEFTKKRGASDIVACYLYFAANAVSGSGGAVPENSSTVIEYFDAEALRDFLYRRDKSSGGMLQKFVLPKGTSNATVRAIWSPKICLLERRVNLRNVHDKRFSVYERGVTFDGADLHSRPEPVRGAMLPGEVQLLCEQVVDHVTQVSYHKNRIARMVLHLKTDADDRLWLLWCSSLRLLNLNASESGALRPLDIVNDAQVPEFARLPFGQSNSASIAAGLGSSTGTGSRAIHHHHERDQDEKRMGFARCMSCGQLKEQRKLLASTYKAVLDHFQRFMQFLRLQVNEGEHAAIEWPPDERFVQAAGGVGFGILQCFEKGSFSGGGGTTTKKASQLSSSGAAGTTSSLTRKELVIPPVIQYLHPNFSVDDFERHRHDPLFLHKPVAVCESCCLVYSDYTTSSLEVNSIRQSAPAILRPHCELSDAKKRLDPLDPLAAALATSHSKLSPPASGTRSLKKPPASAWKPVAETRKAPRVRGPQTGLSSLPVAPQLPQRIDSFGELQSANLAELTGSGGSSLGSSQSASALLQQREETFFRELHQQKDLERGHPLHHMLESATRLAVSKRQQQQRAALRLSSTNGDFVDGFGRSRSVGMLPDLLEQQLASKKVSSKSPYSVVIRLRESIPEADDDSGLPDNQQVNERSPVKLVKPTATKKGVKRGEGNSKKKKKKSRCQESGAGSEDEQQPNVGANAAARFVSFREKKASEEHQEFLFAALSQAEAQLENIESLASLLPETAGSDSVAVENRRRESDGDEDEDGSECDDEGEGVDRVDEDEHADAVDRGSADVLNEARAACCVDVESDDERDSEVSRDTDEVEVDTRPRRDADESLEDTAAAVKNTAAAIEDSAPVIEDSIVAINDSAAAVEGDKDCEGGGSSARSQDDGYQIGERDPDDPLSDDDEAGNTRLESEDEALAREQSRGEYAHNATIDCRDGEDHPDTVVVAVGGAANELLDDPEQPRDQEAEQEEEFNRASAQPLKDEEVGSVAPPQDDTCESDAQ